MSEQDLQVSNVLEMPSKGGSSQEETMPKVYHPHFCWSNVGKKKDFMLCNTAAGYYKVFRANNPTAQIYIWFCPKHLKLAQRAGYQCHPATYVSEVTGESTVTLR